MEKKGIGNGKKLLTNSTSRNNRTNKTTSKKNSTKISSETRKISTVSDETKKYKIDDKDVNNNKNKSVKNNKTKKAKAWNIVKKILIALFILGILAGLILAGIVAGIFFGFFGDDFKMTKEDLVIPFSNSEVYDADGNLICTLNGTEQRKIVSLDQMPKYLPKAYVAIEDERFYEHSGVDIKRTGAATITYLLHRGNSSFGGSSITQQLIKNITKEDEDSALRKVKEMARAIQVEKEISKDNILELYLNVIFVGGNNINGVALGAQYYFNKDVSTLDLAECAFLAGINHTPNSYNPFNGTEEQKTKNIESGRSRTKTVLKKMLELGYVSQEDYNNAIAKVDNGLTFEQGILTSGIVYNDHVELAIDQIVKQLMDEKGMDRNMAETVVYGGGYKIYTTQVTNVQNILETEMSETKYVEKGAIKNGVLVNPENAQSQSAMVIIDHTTGKVVACKGRLGAKTVNGDLNRVNSPRQVGSAMKPLSVIAPAVQENVINPESTYVDESINDWYGAPVKNHYAGFHGTQTVRAAIRESGNIIPIKILRDTGVLKSIEYLNKMGLTGLENFGEKSYSLALGAKEYSTLQIAAGYATIANDGKYIEPTFYSKVTDAQGNTIIEPHQKNEQVFGKSESYVIKSIVMEPTKSGGTATYCNKGMNGFDICAKTGTADNSKDRWLCEFTTYYTAACWYGYDTPETVRNSGNPAGQICSAVMRKIHSGLTPTRFTKPDDITTATVCSRTNKLPSEGCPTVTGMFVKSRIPTTRCNVKHNMSAVKICEETGLLAIEGACPKVKSKVYEEGEELPKEYCNVHKKPEETPNQEPSVSPSPSTSTKPSVPPSPSTSTKPSTSPSPSTSTKPSTSPSPSTSTKPSTSPSPSTSTKPSVSPSPSNSPTTPRE